MKLEELKGLGPTRLQTLSAMGISSLRDLLYHLPLRYEDRTTASPCAELRTGMTGMVEGLVTSEPKISFFNGLSRVSLTLQDLSGRLAVVWFNQPWMKEQFRLNDLAALYGTVTEKNGRRMMVNPQKVQEREILPVYRAVKGLPAKTYREIMRKALEQVEDCLPESLPQSLRLRYGLCELNYAIRQAHFPDSLEALKIARRRISFEQMLLYQVLVALAGRKREKGFALDIPPDMPEEYWKRCGFEPTSAQKRALSEIRSDLCRDVPMSRMVQGDVGCGKTAIALGAMVMACSAGYQCLMMAPTEILARQHEEGSRQLLESFGLRTGLILGSTRTSERRRLNEAAASGEIDVFFGTHALISENMSYRRLGLVITDEQHRFGVQQRSALQNKGAGEAGLPHVLVMSATPIPRSLALILYGDLELSLVDELPPGRKPVATRIVPESKREDMYGFLRRQVAEGRQAYVICPLVEDSEADETLRSVQSTYDALCSRELKDLRVGLTWGGQAPAEKADTLRRFAAGEMDVLVSTTVVEVGVNVPNAAVMVIENAQRYGLAQLHQLRGRVGRGTAESWCFLVGEANERLRTMTQTNDGFVIAQKDLELRGPGDLMGVRQSGEAMDGFLLNGDMRQLEETHACMKSLRDDPALAEERKLVEEQALKAFPDTRIARN